MFRDRVVSCFYQQYRNDPWLSDLLQAVGFTADEIVQRIAELPEQMFFDTMTWQLAVEERMADLRPEASASDIVRRSALEAKWRTGGRIGLAQLQAIADSWAEGKAQLHYEEDQICIDIRENIAGVAELRKAIHEARPAHLPVWFWFLLVYFIHAASGLRMGILAEAAFSPWRRHKAIHLNGSYAMDGETRLDGVVEPLADHYPTVAQICTGIGLPPGIGADLEAAWKTRTKPRIFAAAGIATSLQEKSRQELQSAVATDHVVTCALPIGQKTAWCMRQKTAVTGECTEEMTIMQGCRTNESTKLTAKIKISAGVADVSAYIEKDWYTLDGSLYLDGAHKLCADRYTVEG